MTSAELVPRSILRWYRERSGTDRHHEGEKRENEE